MKKPLVLVILSMVLLPSSTCSISGFTANVESHGAEASVLVKDLSDLKIAIDPGHGGIDKGTVGIETGVYEATLTLQIAKLLEDRFKSGSTSVVMTRETADVNYTGQGDTQKLRDMNNRIRLVKDQNPDVLVSIHMNTFSDRSVRGAQVFYQKGSAQSGKFAQSIQQELNVGINAKNARHIESGDYYLLKGVDCPSVIVECGFLSNYDDEKNLQNPDYQKELIECIYRGICDYLGTK